MKLRVLIAVLGLFVLQGCATTFTGQCYLQPVGAAQGILLANVHCEAVPTE